MTLYRTIATKNGGITVAMTAEEESAHLTVQAEQAAAQPRLDILAKIAALESKQTPRRMREALSDPTFINDLNSKIVALRNQL